jgi:integrase
VAAAFLERHVAGLAKAADAHRTISSEFVSRWGSMPITDIQPSEIAVAIRAIVKRGTPYQAHIALGYLRRMFSWAIGMHEFGITESPVERLRAKDLIGSRLPRARVLTDSELYAVWRAAGEMGCPFGPLIQLLILIGQREREVSEMSWAELDFANRLWTIPARRMKGDRAHEVPLGADAIALLEVLPRFTAGGFVFTTTGDVKPVNGFSKAK